jgi:GcrA cell cycle regulator
MSRWTDEELRELAILWSTTSVSQIAQRLHRPRSAISSKAKQQHKEGLLPRNLPTHFDVNPPKRPRRKPRITTKPPPPPQVDDSLLMQPCSIRELDQTRCHWPLGNVNPITTKFCGCTPAPGHSYCRHHLQMLRYSFL